jgi:two-component system, LuxR family, secretion system response regulator SsrB
MNVFLVEDSPHICERLKELLEVDGKHIVSGCADTFAAAVEGIVATKPDVGIFDIQLKSGNGIDALTEVKRLMPGLVGIVLSNALTAQNRAAGSNAGAAYVLDKSSDFDRLAAILAELPGS